MLKKKIFLSIENDVNFQKYLYFSQVIFFSGLLVYYSVMLILSGDPLLSRVGNPYSGHTISWIAILVSALCIRLKTPYKEYPLYNAIQSLLAFMLGAMITEGVWHLFYLTIKPEIDLLTLSTKLEIIVGVTTAFIAGTYDLFDKRKFWTAVCILSIYFIGWRLLGMPVSLEIGIEKSKSMFYYSSFVNLIEVSQWLIGMSLFSLAYKGKHMI